MRGSTDRRSSTDVHVHVHTERGLDRLVTFVDAIVAIAATLLVLPLVDAVAAADRREPASHLLHSQGDLLWTFGLSFVIIARLWAAHHHHVERAARYDQRVLTLSLLWALTIVVVPFTTRLLPVYGSQRLVYGLYSGDILISSALLSLLSWRIQHHRELQAPSLDARALSAVEPITTTLVLVVIFVVGLLVPRLGYYPFLLLLFGGTIARRWTRHTS